MRTYWDIVGDGGSDVAAQVEAQTARLRRRMADVRAKVAVVSGKGGVGKSTLTANLAAALARDGLRIGVLDADLNGPSMAKLLGVRGRLPEAGPDGIRPPDGPLGIKVVSMDLLLPSDTSPVAWRGPTQRESFIWRGMMEMNALREFLADTAWGELDLLLADLPPGTDRIAHVTGLLPDLTGCLLVTLASEVSHLTVKKTVSAVRDARWGSAVGLVENMACFTCRHCGASEQMYPGTDTAAMAGEMGIVFLGSIDFDPRLAAASDRGVPFVISHPDTPASTALTRLARVILGWVEGA
jgi:ATP-binding protein involved in chromosome partitioning